MTGSTVDYSTDIMWDLFPDESVKTTQIQPTVKNVQFILLKYTQWNQLTKEKKKKKGVQRFDSIMHTKAETEQTD